MRHAKAAHDQRALDYYAIVCVIIYFAYDTFFFFLLK